MATDPAVSHWNAAGRSTAAAIQARDLAVALERRNGALADRLRPVVTRHSPQVWSSEAATLSRLRLYVGATAMLGRAREELVVVISSLRGRASDLEAEARNHRNQARTIEAEAVLADRAGIQSDPSSNQGSNHDPTSRPGDGIHHR